MKKLLFKLRSHQTEIFIFTFFILLSLIGTYPLIFKMRSYLYGPGGDSLGTVWFFWWSKYAHLNNISSHLCPIIAFPFGVDYSYSLPLLVNFFGKWLSILINEVFAYNFILFLTFLLSAVTMYLLVHYFTSNKIASLVTSLIYTFSPYHFTRAFCHICQANIQWMPIYALALFYLDEKRTYGNAILCALIFSLNVFTNYEYGYFMAIFTVAFVVWRGWQGLRNKRLSGYPVTRLSGKKTSRWESEKVGKGETEKRRNGETGKRENRLLITNHRSALKTVKVMLVAIVVAVAVILPLTYYPFQNMFATPKRYARPIRDLFSNSARPLGYLLPSQDNPLFGRFTKRFIKSPFYGGHPTEHTLYLGWVGIVLSIVAVREWRRKSKLVNKLTSRQVNKLTSRQVNKLTRSQKASNKNWQTGKLANWQTSQKGVSFFLFAAIVALIFSHSPYTEIGNFRILFPSHFMYKILPMFRCYARFGIVVMLCVSVLAGIGLASILKKIKSTKKRRVFLFIILLLIFIEFAPTLPAPMVNAVNPPPVYEWLAKEEGDFIVAEYPIETDYEYLFWQRIHQKRLVNGVQSGTYADKVRKEIVDILKPETPGILKFLGAKYVILHSDKYLKSEDVPVIGEVPDVSKQKGLKLVETFEEARVYEVIAAPRRPKVEKVGK